MGSCEEEKLSCPTSFRTPNRPERRESQHRLHYRLRPYCSYAVKLKSTAIKTSPRGQWTGSRPSGCPTVFSVCAPARFTVLCRRDGSWDGRILNANDHFRPWVSWRRPADIVMGKPMKFSCMRKPKRDVQGTEQWRWGASQQVFTDTANCF